MVSEKEYVAYMSDEDKHTLHLFKLHMNELAEKGKAMIKEENDNKRKQIKEKDSKPS